MMDGVQPTGTTAREEGGSGQLRRARSRGIIIGFLLALVVVTSFQGLFWSFEKGWQVSTLSSEEMVARPKTDAPHGEAYVRDGASVRTPSEPTIKQSTPTSEAIPVTTVAPAVKSETPTVKTTAPTVKTTAPNVKTAAPTVKSEPPTVPSQAATELPPVKFTAPKPPYKEIKWPLACPAGRKGTERPILLTHKPHILVGVLARNREPYQETFAQALKYSLEKHPEWKPYVHVRVYDDASDEVSADRTKQRFSMAERFIMLNHHTGLRGGGITETFQFDCAATNYDICVVGDSDTILHPDWIPVLVRNMNKTDGQVTLYNSCLHGLGKCEGELCEKVSVGGALNILTRKLLLEINCNVGMAPNNDPSFDFIWGDYIKWTGRKMYTLIPSMGEHLGIYGASNGAASQNEQSRDFNLFDLPQPLSSLVYTQLESRMNSVCNKKKLEKPPGWDLQTPAMSDKERQYFLLNPRN